jgi:hypothetical protein
MDVTVELEYDPVRDILFAVDHGELTTPEHIDAFFSVYDRFFATHGKKVYIVANIDNLLVRNEVAEEYSRRGAQTVRENVLGVARWGTNSWARMTVRTTALKANMPANIFDTEEEAIAAIEEMQRGDG